MNQPRPLFLIGMPRSGTKLLRTILNQHPAIGIATSETEFLPNWIRGWERFGDLSRRENFHRFYQSSLRFPYFQNLRRKGNLLTEEAWYANCSGFDLPSVFAAVVMHNIGPKPGLAYWGDKSPGYTFWVREINKTFPDARFVHIVRDPRDYALSVRQAWGRNYYRAVQQWKVGVRDVAQQSRQPNLRLHTIRFEDMLQAPEATLTALCKFLELEFLPQMLEIGRVESVGDAAHRSGIVADNMNKFKSKLSPSELRGIESICGQAMTEFGYEPIYESGDAELSGLRMAAIRVFDSWNVLRSNAQRRGWVYGFKHAVLFRLMRIGAGKSRRDPSN